MGNSKSKPQLNEENQRMEGSRVVKDPPPPYTEVASDLAVATPDHSTLSFTFDASNQLTAIEDKAPVKAKVGIDDMPYEIMTLVFDELSLCSKTCLGVTCKMFYEILKKQHPEPISLFYEEEKRAATSTPFKGSTPLYHSYHVDRLGWYLQDWSSFAAGYKLVDVEYGTWIFVNREVYGPFKGKKENKRARAHQRAMESRYCDWRQSEHLCKMAEMGSDWGHGDLTRLLPHPFNKGERWDQEVLTIAEANLRDIGDYEKWTEYWSMFRIWDSRWEDFRRIKKNAM
jgi:hypothetical protein